MSSSDDETDLVLCLEEDDEIPENSIKKTNLLCSLFKVHYFKLLLI